MRIIDTKITKEMLSGDNFPQLKIGDKLYTVDNRQSTFDKIQEIQNDVTLTDKEKQEKTYELALGTKEAKEINELDLSVESNVYLSFCIMGAITGQNPDELMEAAKKGK